MGFMYLAFEGGFALNNFEEDLRGIKASVHVYHFSV